MFTCEHNILSIIMKYHCDTVVLLRSFHLYIFVCFQIIFSPGMCYIRTMVTVACWIMEGQPAVICCSLSQCVPGCDRLSPRELLNFDPV